MECIHVITIQTFTNRFKKRIIMTKKCKYLDWTKETIDRVLQVRQNENTRKRWIKAASDAYPNLVLGNYMLLQFVII